ncbi:MAG: hypothetical protein M3Z32_00645 [Acidobacteriota bacterium]|nr:hypothetical protein [Acidobacteriota bacterium]
MAQAPQDSSRARIDGWKKIAEFFGRSVRSVQEWEQEGLKIYRFQNRVWAYKDDLEHFQASRLVPPQPAAPVEPASGDLNVISPTEATPPNPILLPDIPHPVEGVKTSRPTAGLRSQLGLVFSREEGGWPPLHL